MAACRLISDSQCSLHILSRLRDTVANSSVKDKVPLTDETINALGSICKEISKIGHSEAIKPFTLSVNAEEWVLISLMVYKQDEYLWQFFKPQARIDGILEVLKVTIAGGAFSSETLDVIKVTNKSLQDCDWSPLALAMQERLSPASNSTVQETNLLLQGLPLLKSFNNAQADNSLDLLASNGSLMHRLHQAQSKNNTECSARLLTAFMAKLPDAAKPTPPIGNSESGYTILTKMLATDNPDLAKLIVDILDSENNISLLIKIVEVRGNKYDPLITSCLRYVADSSSPERLYSPEVIISYWRGLEEQLNADNSNRFDKLLGDLSSKTDILDYIRQQESGFNYEDSWLYLQLCKVSSSQEFRKWCQEGIEGLDSSIWEKQLNEQENALELLIFLIESGANITMKQPFQDALISNAGNVLTGKAKIKEYFSKWPMLFETLRTTASRSTLRRRLLRLVISKEGKGADTFLQIYGGELLEDITQFYSEEDIVAKLFSPLLRDSNIIGLRWLKSLFIKDPVILKRFADKDAVNDIVERIQVEIGKQADDGDEIHALFLEIAAILGITIEAKDNINGSDNIVL